MADERDREQGQGEGQGRDNRYGRDDDWRQREQLENSVNRAADRAVRQALLRLGVSSDGDGGRETSVDLAYLRRIRSRSEDDEEYRADKEWVRRTRKRIEAGGGLMRQGAVDLAVKAVLTIGGLIVGWAATHFGIGIGSGGK